MTPLVVSSGTADVRTAAFVLVPLKEKVESGGGHKLCLFSEELLLLLLLVINPLRTFSVQHGVQLVSEVIKHVANVVQDGPC